MELSEIRFKEHVGIITSDTNIQQFTFFVTPLSSKIGVGKGEYVIVDHPFLGEHCPLLSVVKSLNNYEEIVGTSLREDKSIKIMATSEIIGYIDLRDPTTKPLRKLNVPPKPGSKVYLPYYEFLEDIFLRRLDGKPLKHSIHLGKLESKAHCRADGFKELNFYMGATDFTNQHFLISGISGSGKTHTATVIIEELANKTNHPIIVLDPFGEYTSIGIAGKSLKQMREEGNVTLDNYPFDFSVSIHTSNKERVINNLKESAKIHKEYTNFSIKHIRKKKELEIDVKRNQITILDAKELSLEERQRFFISYVKAFWNDRVDGRGEPFLLVIEEPQALEGSMINRIASEGRKIGVSMCLLSQHPTMIDSRILSQMGTMIMGRTIDAQDIEYLKNIAIDKSPFLTLLKPGEWIVNGVNLNRPMKILVRDRYSPSSTHATK
ncbi:MAG: ATP-binding protein [Candidatus Bathyarchaeota archaeon]|nr:MAG: ATP-binding protein [Candidatus Bathyarchaeota archaeon]